MTSKPTSKIPGHQRSPKVKPRSFGEQWTAKGDAFTRSVSKTRRSPATAKPIRTS